MNIEKVNAIREALGYFEDAELVTLVNETELLVKNKNNGSVWKINYVFENEFILNGEGAELVQEGITPEQPLTPKNFAKGFFGNEYSIDEMKAKLMEVVFKSSPIVEEENILKVEEDEELSLRETLTAEEKILVDGFISKYIKTIEEQEKSINSFLKEVAYVFETDGTPKSKTFLNPKKILDIYSEKIKLKQVLVEGAEVFKKFTDEVASLLEENEIDVKFVDVVLEGFEPTADMGTKYTKNILKLKKENGFDISIAEAVKQLKAIQKTVFEGFDVSKVSKTITSFNEGVIADYGGGSSVLPKIENFSFLRFGANFFSRENVRALLEDFNAIMARFNSLSMEELQEVGMMKDMVEYMFRTGNIDDEVVTGIIETFNKKFGEKRPVEAIEA